MNQPVVQDLKRMQPRLEMAYKNLTKYGEVFLRLAVIVPGANSGTLESSLFLYECQV